MGVALQYGTGNQQGTKPQPGTVHLYMDKDFFENYAKKQDFTYTACTKVCSALIESVQTGCKIELEIVAELN